MMQDHDLDALFTAARANSPAPSDALMARVLADALEHQPQARPMTNPPAPAPQRGGFWHALLSLFGGAGAMAGMGGAAVAGLLIGYVQPTGLASLSDALLGGTVDTVQLMPSVDPLLNEVSQ